MGIEVQSLKLLLLARQMGVDFSDTLTIGRQDMFVDDRQVQSAFARFGETLSAGEARQLSGSEDRFSTAIFDRLGVKRLNFMDISDFEGATVIHDLNTPLDPALAGRHTLVFDGGTLEHVFDCPSALRSYMALPQVGGHLIIAVPANNEMGHGFYQFSPELFFRSLTPDNGYELRAMFSVPLFTDADWLRISDPAVVGGRVGFNASRKQTYLFVIARRTAEVALFAKTPQQSDYVAEWAEGEKSGLVERRPTSAVLKDAARRLVRKPLNLARSIREASIRPDPLRFAPFSPGRSPAP